MGVKKCSKDCNYFQPVGNTDETGAGLCKYYPQYCPTTLGEECSIAPKPLTCKDCSRFGNDYACSFQCAEDSIYSERGVKCIGFIDKRVETISDIIMDARLRGEDFAIILAKAYEIADRIYKPLEEN